MDVPIAHSLAEASVAVLEGVVAFVAQSLAEPVAVSTPVPPIAWAFAEKPKSLPPATLSVYTLTAPFTFCAQSADSNL